MDCSCNELYYGGVFRWTTRVGHCRRRSESILLCSHCPHIRGVHITALCIFVPKVLNHQDGETERKELVGASLERMKKRSSSAGTSGRRFPIRLSTFSSSSGESSGEFEGTKILEHPKLRAGLNDELASLKEKNKRLEKRLEELVGPEPIRNDEQALFS